VTHRRGPGPGCGKGNLGLISDVKLWSPHGMGINSGTGNPLVKDT
jgi:hypothetical protein